MWYSHLTLVARAHNHVRWVELSPIWGGIVASGNSQKNETLLNAF